MGLWWLSMSRMETGGRALGNPRYWEPGVWGVLGSPCPTTTATRATKTAAPLPGCGPILITNSRYPNHT
eukprot:8765403-Pyramimonas_sp.AAC.1